MYDLLKASDGVVAHGTGDLGVQGMSFCQIADGASCKPWADRSHLGLQVEFRMIVFRPFKGEVLSGKIIAQSTTGLQGESETV